MAFSLRGRDGEAGGDRRMAPVGSQGKGLGRADCSWPGEERSGQCEGLNAAGQGDDGQKTAVCCAIRRKKDQAKKGRKGKDRAAWMLAPPQGLFQG